MRVRSFDRREIDDPQASDGIQGYKSYRPFILNTRRLFIPKSTWYSEVKNYVFTAKKSNSSKISYLCT